jgi:DNA transformation protein
VSPDYLEFLKDQLASFGSVTAKRMFGGAGLYREGIMFALVDGETLYLKTDAASRGAFEAEGLRPFSYATKHGTNTLTSYWRAPERCFDDPDEMTIWAERAWAAALRARKP